MVQLIAIVLVGALAGAHALLSNEACPQDVPVKQDFSVKDYMGRWYEIKRYPQFYEHGMDCNVAEYTAAADGGFDIKNGGFYLANETSVVATGKGVFTYPDEQHLQGKFNVAFFRASPDRSNYWVLDTDYTHYAVVWSCEPYYKDPSSNVVGLWVLSRTPHLPTDVVEHVNELVKKYGDASKFEVPTQDNKSCPTAY